MRVFVTGASGGIGSVVVPELVAAGHEVLGLTRSERSAQIVTAAGGTAIRGGLGDLDVLTAGAEQSDGVISLAFGNDFNNLAANIAEEGLAMRTLGAALIGTGKPFVVASGTPVAVGRPSTEQDPTTTDGPVGGRGLNSLAVLELATKGVRSAAVRLPRSVHERGIAYGFAGVLIAAAQRTGISGYIGDGSQRWPSVHRRDAARLFRLALEHADAGTVAHAVADQGETMLSIAEAIGRQLGTPVEQVPAENFGPLGPIFSADQPSSSEWTSKHFAWEPTFPSLLEDLEAGDYPIA